MDKLKKDFKDIKPAIIPLLIYMIFMQYFFGTVCPVKAFLGIECPGCGMTHAAIYMFTFQFNKSWHSNPTCILWIITILMFLYDRYIKPIKFKPFPMLFTTVGLITIIRYIFHMLGMCV